MSISLHGIRVSSSETAAEAEQSARTQNLTVWRIDLGGVSTKSDLLALLGRDLGMPDYLSNWDALEECLRDLDEGNGWLLILEHADSLLEMARQDVTVFAEILSEAAEFWMAERKAFAAHFVGGTQLKEALHQCCRCVLAELGHYGPQARGTSHNGAIAPPA